MATIPDWFPYTYTKQIQNELQQMESRIKQDYGTFYQVPEAGLRFQIGGRSTSTQRSRGWVPTNPNEATHRSRWLHMHGDDTGGTRDYRLNDEWIDELDAKRLGEISDPTPNRIAAQVAKANRDCDAAIIAGLSGNIYSGDTSPGSATARSDTPTVDEDFGTANSGFTFVKINHATALLGAANVTGQRVEGNTKKCIVCTHFEIEDLLQDQTITSFDYATQKRAESGSVFDYQDFTFIPVDPGLLPVTTATNIRTCYAFTKSSIAIGSGVNRIHEVTKENSQNGAILLHMVDGYTCTTIYDRGVVAIESYRTDAQETEETGYEDQL